jgi:hypothetical protein
MGQRNNSVRWHRSGVEQFGERTCCEARSEFAAVAGVFEEVGVDIECDRGACVTEDAAYLCDI